MEATDEEMTALRELKTIPNIGPACARDLLLLEIRSVGDLKGRSPDQLYEELCAKTRTRQDPCVWDTLAAAVHFADTGERKAWWEFTPVRKARNRGS